MHAPLRLKNRHILACSTVFAGLLAAQAISGPPHRPPAQSQPASVFAPIKDRPGLPRVLLIGDSISIGYTKPVRNRLEQVANVHRIPENGGPTLRGIDHIENWLGHGHWDVIHFNWGLHDLKQIKPGERQVPLNEYEKNLRRLVARLKQTGATLIWASTTPVPNGADGREPQDVLRYNKAALAVMREQGIAVDDLYAFALPRLAAIQMPQNVHYTAAGYEALAKPVAESIRKALAERGSASSQPAAATRPSSE